MNIALIMLVVYLLITTGVGIYFSRKKQSSSQFMVAKSSLGIVLIVPLLFSELIAGAGTIGNAASAFNGGYSSVWANWGMVLGCWMFVLLTCKFYRSLNKKYGVISVPEAYSYIFDGRCRTVLLVIVVMVYGILYSTQPVAAAAIIGPLIGVNDSIIVWVITGVFILVTVSGGMRGIAGMNVVHAVIMYAGMAFIAYKSVSSVGGMVALKEALPVTYFSFMQSDPFTTLANALGTGVSFLAAATVASVAFGAKNEKTAKNGIIIASFVVLPFALFPALIGMSAKVRMPDSAPNEALFNMSNSLGSVFGGIASMAIIAAIWSTGPALLLVISTTLTRDLFGRVKPEATDAQQLFFSRAAIVVIALLATFFGMNAGSILGQMYGAFQIRSIAGVVLVVALAWPRVTKSAAFWSMLMGGAVAAIWHFTGNPFGIAPLWPSTFVCLLILIPITLRSKEKISEGHRKYREALDELKEEANEN